MDEAPQIPATDFEQKKWQKYVEFQEEELRIKEREQKRLETEADRSRWWNPLFIAIVGAIIAAIASILVSWWNGRIAEATENTKAESARIIEMIKADSLHRVRRNLQFLVDADLIIGKTKDHIKRYLAQNQTDQELPLLPSSSWTQPASPTTEAAEISKFRCPGSAEDYWIYHYTARLSGEPTYGVIRPPNWGQPVGGHELFTQKDAEATALAACNAKQNVSIRNGMIVASQNTGGTTYLIEDGKKRAIPHMTTFQNLGFTWDRLERIPENQLNNIPTGNPIPRTTAPLAAGLHHCCRLACRTPTPQSRMCVLTRRSTISCCANGCGKVERGARGIAAEFLAETLALNGVSAYLNCSVFVPCLRHRGAAVGQSLPPWPDLTVHLSSPRASARLLAQPPSACSGVKALRNRSSLGGRAAKHR